MGREEVVPVSTACIGVAVEYEEACTLQTEISVCIDYRIVTDVCLLFVFLRDELSEYRAVVGRMIFGEVASVDAQVAV